MKSMANRMCSSGKCSQDSLRRNEARLGGRKLERVADGLTFVATSSGRTPNSQVREVGHAWWSWPRRSEATGQERLRGMGRAVGVAS